MKRLICTLILVVLIVSMFPVMSVTAKETVEGEFIPMKLPNVSDDSQWPLAGYKYTSEGFVSISPDYTNYTVRQCIVTRNSYRLDTNNDADGHVLSLEFTVESFPYKGESGSADEWIAIAVWDEQEVNQESDGKGHGYHTLIRGGGEGTESCLSFVVNGNGCEMVSTVQINPELDANGHEKYTFTVDRDNSGDYSIQVCGVDIGYFGSTNIEGKDAFNSFVDHAYLSVTLHSTASDEGAAGSIKITKFNGNTPYGEDSAAPEENKRNFAPIADSNTVATNQPALLWDASLRDTSSLSGKGTFTPNENGTVTCIPTDTTPWIFWNVKADSSYSAEDFPIVAYLTKNLDSNIAYFYCAGDILAPGNDCAISGSYDDYDLYDNWELSIVDLSDLCSGRINAIRADSNERDLTDDDGNYEPFEIGFLAFFRTEEEAVAYANEFLAKVYTGVDTAIETTAEAETTVKQAETAETNSGSTTAEVTNASEPSGTTAANTAETTATASKSGCKSFIGGFALVAVVTLAAVSVKKKK